jgi:hypothetical protein
LRAYVGEYQIAPNVPVKVTLDGASLFLQLGSGSPQRLRPLSPHEFHAPELGRLTFSEQAGAPMQIALMRFGQNQTAHRRTTLTARAAARYVGVYYSSELDAIYRIAYRDGRLWLDHRRGAAEMIQAGPDTFATLAPLDFECRNDRTYCAPFATLRFSCSAPGDCAGLALSTERVSNLAFRRASLP